MITSFEDYVRAINAKLDLKPVSVWISTFGLQTGVSSKGSIFDRSATYQLLQRLNTGIPDARVLIGWDGVDRINRSKIQNAADLWRGIKFRTMPDLHLKAWIFTFPKLRVSALGGGRNLSDSTWSDGSYWLDHTDVTELVRFYKRLWAKASSVEVAERVRLVSRGRQY